MKRSGRYFALLLALIVFAASALSCEKVANEILPGADGAQRLDFDTEDVEGNPVSMATFGSCKVVMVNFWEEWCPPCISEIPDLEDLYRKYSGNGFIILGVYSQSDREKVLSAAADLGITYPIIPTNASFRPYSTQYVPTTVFFNGAGERIDPETYVGAKSYGEWESIIVSLLNAQ